MKRYLTFLLLTAMPLLTYARFDYKRGDPARLVFLVAMAAIVLLWLIRRNRS